MSNVTKLVSSQLVSGRLVISRLGIGRLVILEVGEELGLEKELSWYAWPYGYGSQQNDHVRRHELGHVVPLLVGLAQHELPIIYNANQCSDPPLCLPTA